MTNLNDFITDARVEIKTAALRIEEGDSEMTKETIVAARVNLQDETAPRMLTVIHTLLKQHREFHGTCFDDGDNWPCQTMHNLAADLGVEVPR